MSNSINSDETAHEPSHLDLCCLQKPNIIACGSERVNILHNMVCSHSDKHVGQISESDKMALIVAHFYAEILSHKVIIMKSQSIARVMWLFWWR